MKRNASKRRRPHGELQLSQDLLVETMPPKALGTVRPNNQQKTEILTSLAGTTMKSTSTKMCQPKSQSQKNEFLRVFVSAPPRHQAISGKLAAAQDRSHLPDTATSPNIHTPCSAPLWTASPRKDPPCEAKRKVCVPRFHITKYPMNTKQDSRLLPEIRTSATEFSPPLQRCSTTKNILS